jgi:hypothetical protein
MSDQDYSEREDPAAELARQFSNEVIDSSKKVTKLSEVAEEISPTGSKIKLEEMVDQTITIIRLKWIRGAKGIFAFMVFADSNGELFNASCGGRVAVEKLFMVKDHLPLETTVTKKTTSGGDWYWDFE